MDLWNLFQTSIKCTQNLEDLNLKYRKYTYLSFRNINNEMKVCLEFVYSKFRATTKNNQQIKIKQENQLIKATKVRSR